MKLTEKQLINLLFTYNDKKQMIDHIIKDDESSLKEFEKYLEVWEKSAGLKDYQNIDTKADWEKVRSRISTKQRTRKLPYTTYFLRIAAIFILAIGLTYLLTQVINIGSTEVEYTEIASSNNIREVALPDGSSITLNKASSIVYNNNFSIENRDIILQGQAFFNVARNEELPFKVHTHNSVVEVLGTKFDINTDSTLVVVGVLSGKVALYESTDHNNRIELNTLSTGMYNATDRKITYSETFDHNTLLWRTKKFVFRNEPLEKVCEVLANYYELELEAGDKVEFIDSINVTCSSESIDHVIEMINSFVLEDIELLNTGEKLIVRKQ